MVIFRQRGHVDEELGLAVDFRLLQHRQGGALLLLAAALRDESVGSLGLAVVEAKIAEIGPGVLPDVLVHNKVTLARARRLQCPLILEVGHRRAGKKKNGDPGGDFSHGALSPAGRFPATTRPCSESFSQSRW